VASCPLVCWLTQALRTEEAFQCLRCWRDEGTNALCCKSCAENCHASHGHDVDFVGVVQFSCRCTGRRAALRCACQCCIVVCGGPYAVFDDPRGHAAPSAAPTRVDVCVGRWKW
jgi:hypothetical protein